MLPEPPTRSRTHRRDTRDHNLGTYVTSPSRRSPETGPGVESGGGGGECRLSLKSVDSTETRAAVVDSLGVRVRVR